MAPAVEALRSLTRRPDASACLTVMRYYCPTNDESDLSIDLTSDAINFLASTGTVFFCSEYDMSLASDE